MQKYLYSLNLRNDTCQKIRLEGLLFNILATTGKQINECYADAFPGRVNCSYRKYSDSMPQKTAFLRFYEELNDFLPFHQVKKDVPFHFFNRPSVKDVIESFGIPHSEVDLILINGASVDFDCRVNNGDRISVYPKFETLDIASLSRLSGRPLRQTRFILDVHLGKLSRYLRLCGFDTLYDNEYEDHQIVHLSRQQNRIILTRDIGLLKHSAVQHGYWLRSDQPQQQVREVIRRFDLKDQIQLFNRCLECNGKIVAVSKRSVQDQLRENTLKYYDSFYQCSQCKKIYWKGSHYQHMIEHIHHILNG